MKVSNNIIHDASAQDASKDRKTVLAWLPTFGDSAPRYVNQVICTYNLKMLCGDLTNIFIPLNQRSDLELGQFTTISTSHSAHP